MSTIVVKVNTKTKGKIMTTMGVESLGSKEGKGVFVKSYRKKDKTKHEFLVGCIGSRRVVQLIEHELVMPFIPEDGDIVKYVVTKLVRKVSELMKANDVSFSENEMVIVIGGNIYVIKGDLGVVMPKTSYYAIGSSSLYSRGNLYKNDEIDDELAVRQAVQSACRYNLEAKDEIKILNLLQTV